MKKSKSHKSDKKTKSVKIEKNNKKTLHVSRGVIIGGILAATGVAFSNGIYSRIQSTQPRVLGESVTAAYVSGTGGDAKVTGTYTPATGGDTKDISNYTSGTDGDSKSAGTYTPATSGDTKATDTYAPSTGGDTKATSTYTTSTGGDTKSTGTYTSGTGGDSKNVTGSTSYSKNISGEVKNSPYIYKGEVGRQSNGNAGVAYENGLKYVSGKQDNKAKDSSKNSVNDTANYVQSIEARIDNINTDLGTVGLTLGTLTSNGFDTASFEKEVKEIHNLVSDANAKVAKNPAEAESIAVNSGYKLMRLENLLSATTNGSSDMTSGDAVASAQGIAMELSDLKSKLNILSVQSSSADYKALIDDIQKSILKADENMSSRRYIDANISVKIAEKKMTDLESSTGYGTIVDTVAYKAADHRNIITKFVNNLQSLSKTDDNIGKKVIDIAEAQVSARTSTANAIDKLNNRGGFMKFLIGPDYKNVAVIKDEIKGNKDRLAVLNGIASQTSDPLVKTALLDQFKMLQQENSKMESFINEKDSGISLFGWFAKLIA